MRDVGQLEANVAVMAAILHSATKKRIFFENESKDRFKKVFLANGICFEISVTNSS
jgi:hypothetical protein